VIGRGVGPVVLSVGLLAASTHAATLPDWADLVQGAPQATFRAGVEVVTVSVGVRDDHGRVVQNLKRTDFDVVDSGALIAIKDFYTGESPVSLGLLLDISGSMAVSGNIDRARHAVRVALGNLDQGRDEAAFFTFDSKLREVAAFTKDLQWINALNLEGKPFGTTSLFDAIAETAHEVATRGNRQRALLVITDGVDTASRLTAPQVSGIASSIDVPVYLLTVVSPLDHPQGEFSVLSDSETSVGTATLADLARWTGGDMRISSVPAHTSEAVRDLFMELRHQYLITFEPGARPGWHPLEVRTKKKNLIVHARSGYMSGPERLTN
jgi:Ca-activated chloride channel family protein